MTSKPELSGASFTPQNRASSGLKNKVLGERTGFQIREKRSKMGVVPVLPLDTLPIDSQHNIELLRINEVATLFRVSVSEIRRLQYARKLPFIKVGGSVRFAKNDIVAYLTKRRVESIG